MKTSFIDLFLSAASKFPNKIAFVDENATRSFTFSQVEHKSRQVAALILQKQISTNSIIPILLPDSTDYVIAMFGAWLAGNAIAALGESFPQERIEYIKAHCKAELSIDKAFMEAADSCEPLLNHIELKDDDDFAIFYTSGSTGNPKGIIHTLKSFTDGIIRSENVISCSENDVFAHNAPFYFVAQFFIFPYLFKGGTIHLIPAPMRREVTQLEDYIQENKISSIFISPSVLPYFKNKSTSLTMVFSGSERMAGVGKREYDIYFIYGMSETLPVTLYFVVDKAYENTPIGKPFPNVKVHILDNDGNAVKAGEEGELCVEGCFTKGYLNQEELTEDLFKGGVLHTKDIVRQLKDGNYLYVNRKDWMLKINGQRVEPGEIENVLKKLPKVENAVVKGFIAEDGQSYLCAYYIGKDTIHEDNIKAELIKVLPTYMIPSYFVQMQSFPINQNGKLDRKALLAPELSNIQSTYVAPSSTAEQALCKAFEKLLNIEKVGINDDFFSLGGNSIRAMRLQRFCAQLPLSSQIIFKGRTPYEIARLSEIEVQIDLKKLDKYTLTKTQMGIYIECINHKGEIYYNNPRLLTLSKQVNLEKLASCLEKFIEAHPYIKTRIKTDDNGDIYQYRNDECIYSQEIEDIKNIEAVKSELVKPFDLNSDQLFRFRILRSATQNYLFIDFHHIIFDGSSFGVFISDLNQAYSGKELLKEELSGFDIAYIEEKLRTGETYKEAKEWHTEHFEGLNVDSLPLSDQKDDINGFATINAHTGVSPNQIAEYCKKSQVTENVFFNAAFAYLLAAYNNTKEALFTTIYNGRTNIKSSRSIAMLVKTIPIYQNIENITTPKDLLISVQKQLLGCMNNDIFSFAEVSEAFDIKSSLLFAYQGDLEYDSTLCGESIKIQNLLENATGETLAIQVFKNSDNYTIECEYDAKCYTNTLIEEFVNSFNIVLSEFISKQALNEISICTPKQLEVLDKFNDTDVPYDKTKNIIDLFKEQVSLHKEKLAVVYKDNKYTYAQVDEISDRIAAYILSEEIKSESVVAVLIPRCEYMAIAPIGVLKSGCAYQPLDPTYPSERLSFMVEDSNAQLLIVDESLCDMLPDYKGKVLLTKDIPSLAAATKLEVDIPPQNAFSLLYTSGSTGTPKGCIIEHRNMVALVNCCLHYYQLTPEDNVSAYASFGFDASMLDTFSTLTNGATLYVIAEEIRLDLIALEKYFIDNKITICFMTTQVGRQFVLNTENTYLRHMSVGGEKLVALLPPKGYELHNVYGPTECTVVATGYTLNRKETNIPIGRPLNNFKLYIVDTLGNRQPVGGVGELWISGPQVSRGYLNRPEVTNKVFIPNPFTQEEDYDRVYCTGDVVRYLSDGNVEFIGRRDAQVKIRGFRVELTEVEGIIREFPGIQNATVQAYDAQSGGKFIAAFIVSDTKIDITALSDFVLENKPPYILPAVIMQIDEIPLNQNQKVNKKALPKPELQSVEEEGDDASNTRPLNKLEEEIKNIVVEIIGSPNINITTKLSHAGLSSISAIKLAILIYKRFNVNIDSKLLTKTYSIVDIENDIIENMLSGNAQVEQNSEKSGEQSKISDSYPLSYSQLGIYYECMKNPTKTTYNVPFILRYPKEIAVNSIADAVNKIIELNPYLSIRFETQGGNPVQVFTPNTFKAEVYKMDDKEFTQLRHDFVRPFNLSKGPLLKAACVETADFNCLLIDFHHIIFDGTSCDIFITQLNEILEGSILEAGDYSYFNFIDDEISAESSPAYQENKDFFDSRLKECEGGSELSADLSNNADTGSFAEHIEVVATAKEINTFCRQLGVTPAKFYLSAAFYTISRYVNSKQVYISTISSGRSTIKTANTYGMFVKTLPIASFIAQQSVNDYILETAKDFENTIAHENYPYAQLASDYNFKPEIMYAYQVGVLNKYSVNKHEIEVEKLEESEAKFKISIHIDEIDGKECIVVQYNDALYSPDMIKDFAQSMNIVLSNFIKQPLSLVKQVSILSKLQIEQLSKFHMEGSATIPINLFHKGIEEQALLKPNHTALMAIDAIYTFEQMNAQMNRIANALISIGVEPKSRIALLLPRTSKLILSMFGVMKAGGAYIPCDIEYPADRIKHVLDDSNAKYVITTKDRLNEYEKGRAIDIDTLLENTNTDNPNLSISPDDLAYLIYTSGSTGKPKGVMLQHKGICNYLYNHPVNTHVHALATTANAYLSVTTISFDMALKEIGVSLFNGVTLVFANEDQANNPILLAQLFKESGADAFNATPSRMLQYMELPAICEALAKCKIIMSGGEKYSDKLLSNLQKLTSARIFNTYGPTEITVSSNCKELTHSNSISIGRPLLNYVEFVVDSDGNELPAGVVGEMYIGGVGVAYGYNNLEKLTSERFIDYNGQRVYCSGDYAKWDKDGNIIILGRTDNQVKLRGLRIELGEIESCLTKIEGIKTAIVIIRTIKGKEHICAYFTAETLLDSANIKEELKKSLTSYMIPTAYMQLAEIPLTPNGKTDQKALPEPELMALGVQEDATNEIEQKFCDIFARILELDKVGATDNFFDIGGSSLVATRVIIEAANMDYEVAYGDIFANPTPRQLSLLVMDKGTTDEMGSTDIINYDYSIFKPILEANTLDSFRNGEPQEIGNVLLTGATGFLGVHILKELIDRQAGEIYCLLRSKANLRAESRLKSILYYYFENSYEELFGKRLFVIEGDVVQTDVLNDLNAIDTVINCAAIVKHFSKGNEITDVNVGGCNNMIDFCLRTNARLIHVSTMSVNGLSVNGFPKVGTPMKEQELYFGQYIGNEYIHSKFIAERNIIESIQTKGLSAKIMRVGNLAARNSDGEFQINFNTNSFINRLRAFNILGKCPYEQLDSMVEFSPIDEVSKAILLLSTTPRECCIFHPYNHHSVFLGDIFREMTHLNIKISPVEKEEYIRILEEFKADPEKSKALTSIIAYENMAHGKQAIPNSKHNVYTMQVLYRLGYQWPVTSWDYIERFLESLHGLGFFTTTDEDIHF